MTKSQLVRLVSMTCAQVERGAGEHVASLRFDCLDSEGNQVSLLLAPEVVKNFIQAAQDMGPMLGQE